MCGTPIPEDETPDYYEDLPVCNQCTDYQGSKMTRTIHLIEAQQPADRCWVAIVAFNGKDDALAEAERWTTKPGGTYRVQEITLFDL